MRWGIPLFAVFSLAFAPVPRVRPDPGKEDLEKMQGAWVLDHAHRKGVREDVSQEAVWTIDGDRIVTTLGGKPGSTFFITLNGKTKPRSIDLRDKHGSAKVTPGRYRVEGDTLTVGIAEMRPPDLSGFGASDSVWVFKRKKR